MINKAAIRECKVIDVLAICQKLKILWHCKILTSKSNRKMCNILKMAGRRAERMKIWDPEYTVHIYRVLLMSDSLSLV